MAWQYFIVDSRHTGKQLNTILQRPGGLKTVHFEHWFSERAIVLKMSVCIVSICNLT